MRVVKRGSLGLRTASQTTRQRLARARRLQCLNDLRVREAGAVDARAATANAMAVRR